MRHFSSNLFELDLSPITDMLWDFDFGILSVTVPRIFHDFPERSKALACSA